MGDYAAFIIRFPPGMENDVQKVLDSADLSVRMHCVSGHTGLAFGMLKTSAGPVAFSIELEDAAGMLGLEKFKQLEIFVAHEYYNKKKHQAETVHL